MSPFVFRLGASWRQHLFLGVFGAVVAGFLLYYYQKLDSEFSDKYKKSVAQNHVRKEHILPKRGTIFDRRNVPLAMSAPVKNIALDVQLITHFFNKKTNKYERRRRAEIKKIIQQIADKTQVSTDKINEIIKKHPNHRGYPIIYNLNPNKIEQILADKIPGLVAVDDYQRFYPYAELFAEVIGFLNGKTGASGIEKQFNEQLRGQSGYRETLKTASGNPIQIVSEERPMVEGENLTLTLDYRIQHITYDVLHEAFRLHQAKSATAVVLDAKTSEILSMVSYPNGDPAIAQDRITIRNRALLDLFEPGSVMKIFTVAEALELNLVRLSTKIDTNPGVMSFNTHNLAGQVTGKRRITEAGNHNYGVLDVTGVIQKSSNVGTCKIAQMIPREKLYQLFSSIGIGHKTAINFPGELPSRLRDFSKLSEHTYCTNSFGYNHSTTAVQLAQAYAMLANDGILLPVSLIKKDEKPIGKRILSAQTAKLARNILYETVENGTGWRALEDRYARDYTLGGKTGTVHKFQDKKYTDNYLSVFAGFAPISDPAIVVVVVVDDPKGDYFGGKVAAPIFAKITGRTLRVLGVHPDRKEQSIKKKAALSGH